MTLALAITVTWMVGLFGFLLGLWWAGRAASKAYLDGVQYGAERATERLLGRPERPPDGLHVVTERNHPRDELAALRERKENAEWN